MIITPVIRAIVFDMDGVLWHSSKTHAAAYRSVLEGAGIEMPDYTTLAGRRTYDVMSELLEDWRRRNGTTAGGVTATELADAKQATARRLLRDDPPIVANCRHILQALANEKKLALASSASAGTVELFLESSGTRTLFAAVVHGDEVMVAKPNPAIYLLVLRRLGVEPREAVVIEDAPSGVQAALAAGVATVVGVTGTVTRKTLMASGAHYVVSQLADLVP